MQKESIKYLDKQGVRYFAELIQKAVEHQVIDLMFEQIISDGKLEERIQELADEDLIITKDELKELYDVIKEETKKAISDAKDNIISQIPIKATEAAITVVETSLDGKIEDAVKKEIKKEIPSSPIDYVKKSGDTMTGPLSATEITAGRFITSSGIIIY